MSSPPTPTPVWLITATSSGFGKQIALEALSRGHRVIATARDSSKLTLLRSLGAAVLDLDVTADQAVLDAKLAQAAAVYGRLTHVVNAAGYIFVGAVEEASQQEERDVYATNVFGVLRMARAATPWLREAAKEGGIVSLVNFGSLGSYNSGPGVGHYCSTKGAVSSISEGLAAELRPFGIEVCCVEPGYTRTEFLRKGDGGKERRVVARREMEVYGEEGHPVREWKDAMDAVDGRQPGDVERAARVIVDVLTKEGVARGRDIPVRLPLGSDTIKQIRKRIGEYEARVREWEDVARLVDYESEF
ncbi:NAD(P)-binding protein [Coniochaeta ligniaria NRRL 30616]|uniref:NAD(P)-binding protein n=1 Tax=Coniochaeta ligniaria NRRL 30616 TaxID=1408157 RepID=A0A1J7I9B6_9PEZI|nr:NAD(P)-binding protein [Coniochaeta ligniaria NRRL 30616]